jgi:hypothetical protein
MIDNLQGHNDMEPVYVPREVKNPEKIYATLQETRDSCSFKKTEGIFSLLYLRYRMVCFADSRGRC